MGKIICSIQHTKISKAEKTGDKDRKVVHKLMNNAVYRKKGKLMKYN